MDYKKLDRAVKEAKRFIDAADAAEVKLKEGGWIL